LYPEDDINTPAGADPAGESPEERVLEPEAVEAEAAAEQVEEDLDELTVAHRKASEYLELAQRTQADFENYRKRASRDAAAAEERGVAKLAREIISALDNLDLSLAALAVQGVDESNVKGFQLIRDELRSGLARAGVTVDNPKGEAFDPQRHEAIAQVVVEGAEPNSVVEVHQVGYLLGDTVIRAAKVAVAGQG
jgi:molecular chaperone GrpE